MSKPEKLKIPEGLSFDEIMRRALKVRPEKKESEQKATAPVQKKKRSVG